jgi:CHAT domain-containing protein/Flp pilus assembly protein TadD
MRQINVKIGWQALVVLTLWSMILVLPIFGQNREHDVRPLPVGETIERQIKSGGVQIYTVELKQGQLLRLDALEKGADIRIGLFRIADEQSVKEVDFSSGYGRETLTAVIEETGVHLILIGSQKLKLDGSYQLTAQIKEEATGADKERIEAERLLADGLENVNKGSGQELREAITIWEKALTKWKNLGDKYWEGYTNNSLGIVSALLGENRKAFDYWEKQALPLRRAVGDREGEAETLSNICTIYSELGESQKALDCYNQALLLFNTLGDKGLEATIRTGIGLIYYNQGANQKALDNLNQALPLSRFVGDKRREANTLTAIGMVYDNLGDNQKALAYYNQALPFRRAIGDRRGEAETLSNIGNMYFILGERQRAFDNHTQALLLFRAIGSRSGEAHLLSIMMYNSALLGNRRMAIFYGKYLVNIFQQIRGSTQGLDTETQKSFLRSIKTPYQYLTQFLIEEGQLDSAVQVLNLYQDQQFFDFNRDSSAPVRQVTLSLREQEFASLYELTSEKVGQINSQIEVLKWQINTRQPSEQETLQLQKLNAELKNATDAFLTFLKYAEGESAKSPDEKDKISFVPDVSEMQTALRDLNITTKQKTVALYTLIGSDNFYILLITPNEIKVFKSPVKASDLNKSILQFYALLQSPDYDPRPVGKKLYDIVFKPIERKLKEIGAQTLVWSLDGTLRNVPVAALWDGEKYLVERYQNVVFTRADTERMTRAVSSNWIGYGFSTSKPHEVEFLGDVINFKPLDFGKDEIQIFRNKTNPIGIIDGDVFSEDQFTKASLLAIIKQERQVVHISSHFRFYPGDASRSFLLLGDGSIMTLAEMKEQPNLFQGVELVTLSACDTATQRPDGAGKEIDAFAELVQRLGASGVMASLWAVLDRSTSQLMKGFYRYREGGKLSKAEALRKAQLDLLYGNTQIPHTSTNQGNETTRRDRSKDDDVVVESKYRIPFKPDKHKPFAHPYYWSPFVLFGNWK